MFHANGWTYTWTLTAAAATHVCLHKCDVKRVYEQIVRERIEIRDRFKDVIIRGGENISSIEVEGVLLRHPAVLEVAVVGMPHEKWGESPSAFVVRRSGMNASESDLREFARGALAHFKVPTAFRFVDALPKTATGKIQKYVLRGGRAAIAHQ